MILRNSKKEREKTSKTFKYKQNKKLQINGPSDVEQYTISGENHRLDMYSASMDYNMYAGIRQN